MKVKIYQPTKNAMQSGIKNTKKWLLEPIVEDNKYIDSIMGWTGAKGTKQQIKMQFDSLEQAIDFATRKKFDYVVIKPKNRSIKIQSYADNFTN